MKVLEISIAVLLAAAPVVREASTDVRVDQVFEVSLPYQAATGSTWIIRQMPHGIIVLSEAKHNLTVVPGGRGEHVFRLVARLPGHYVLHWELIGAAAVVYEDYWLSLHVSDQ